MSHNVRTWAFYEIVSPFVYDINVKNVTKSGAKEKQLTIRKIWNQIVVFLASKLRRWSSLNMLEIHTMV